MTPDVGLAPAPETCGAPFGPPMPAELVREHDPVPVWVRRMHADGLPTTGPLATSSPSTDSQRFVDRWDHVAAGY